MSRLLLLVLSVVLLVACRGPGIPGPLFTVKEPTA